MRKTKKLLVCGAAAMMVLAGCSSNDTAATSAQETTTAAASESGSAESSEAETTAAEEEVPAGTVELGEYVGIEYTPMDTAVTDEDVEEVIQYALDSNPNMVEVDRAAVEGDTVNIDYVGKKDGVAFDGGTAEGSDLELGSNTFIDGFEEGLVGTKKGDQVTLNLTFPDDYKNEELQGQDVTFDVTVNAVKEKQDAVLNDEFVKGLELESGVSTVDEYKDSIRAELQKSNEDMAKMQMENDVLEAVIANCKFSDIDARVEKDFNEQWEQMNNMVVMYGMDMEFYAAMNGAASVDDFKEMFKEQVSNTVKLDLVFKAIAEKEGLTLEEADYDKLAEMQGVEDISTLVEQAGQEMVDEAALQIKVLDFLTSKAVAK